MSTARPTPAPAPAPPARRPGWRSFASLALVVVVAAGVAEGARAWVHHQRAEALRAVARPGDIRMLSSTTCIFCTQARGWLNRHALPFQECFVDLDATCAEEYDRLGRPGTPTVLVRGQAQRGFDAERITRVLAGAAPEPRP